MAKHYYDQPQGSEWINRMDVLFIKRDHRRILNVQPARLEIYYLASDYDSRRTPPPDTRMIMDFQILSN